MSDTAASLSNTGGGYTIVTHVISPRTSTEPGQIVSTGGPLQKFLKGKPKLLGSVQITIGLLTLLLGILMNLSMPGFTVFGGIAFLGAFMYIITGSLAVSASKNLHRCVVTGALVMNVISTITAAITITLFSPVFVSDNGCSMSPDFVIILLVICSIIQFIISICVSAFACKATCSTGPSVNIIVAPNQAGCPVYTSEQHPLYEVNSAAIYSPLMESPPPYSEKGQPDN
ncbi:membrane-spanning 4-domains subfamily A member 4A-like [Colossoma macropomum]|uniref:membrane-spanning 4-domains subfamily A member 4A-like n=1 Tax=Colossoma macropomum TaxID=42526 RepID=UPI00186564AC|nr:membrane-spanning 4-domains subfamily A member 4A-like [Colossoma macropomum]XP_036427239.1 membrane-spanning 4-domains subfamily A member 4A-like [Colossoma macropomum]XP_036427240.1 membrane-spanning 4-domains subfamily A member 4A-like [Colossoma macropomum]XP_036427241.1 membrane-spanning 4-domains subfamily A member 4A-like [Colossoma macropomum]